MAEREQKAEESRNTAKRIIEEQRQRETTANQLTNNGEEMSPTETSAVDDVVEEKREDKENKQNPTGVVASGSEKAVVKAIADMTFEEFKEIKRGRGRPSKEDQKKRKNSQ